MIAAFATNEIQPRRDLPFDDTIAEQRPRGWVTIRTTLRLKLRLVLLGWDLYELLLLIWAAVAVVTVIDHIEKVTEIKEIIKRAIEISLNQDGILIIR